MKSLISCTALLLLVLTQAHAATQPAPKPNVGTLHRRTYFYAGGQFVPHAGWSSYSRTSYMFRHCSLLSILQQISAWDGRRIMTMPDAHLGLDINDGAHDALTEVFVYGIDLCVL